MTQDNQLIEALKDGNNQLRDNLDRLEAYMEQARDRLCAGKPDEAAKIIEHATDMAANWPDIGGYRALRAEQAEAALAAARKDTERLKYALEEIANLQNRWPGWDDRDLFECMRDTARAALANKEGSK